MTIVYISKDKTVEELRQSWRGLTKLRIILWENSVAEKEALLAKCIDEGLLDHVLELDLSHNGLTKFPASLCKLAKRLQLLNLSFNNLVTLPDSIGVFVELRELNIFANRLVSLPGFAISKLVKMQVLCLARNRLWSLPDSICELAELRDLIISNNQLRSLPNEIGRCSKLKNLGLGGNKLWSLPDSIYELSELEWIDVTFNQLKALPKDIGSLAKLKFMDVYFNPLRSLPSSIAKLSKLTRLYLFNTKLTPVKLNLYKIYNRGGVKAKLKSLRQKNPGIIERLLYDNGCYDRRYLEGINALLIGNGLKPIEKDGVRIEDDITEKFKQSLAPDYNCAPAAAVLAPNEDEQSSTSSAPPRLRKS